MEDEPARAPVQPLEPDILDTPALRVLREYIAANIVTLRRRLEVKVICLGLPCDVSVEETALEVLDDVAVEALQHADRFDLVRSPLPWLLAIGVNVIRRRRAKLGYRLAHEISSQRTSSERSQDGALFDEFCALVAPNSEDHVLDQDHIARLLAPLSAEQRYIIHLRFARGMDHAAIGRVLNISRGYAAVKVYRALQAIRDSQSFRDDLNV